MEDVKEKPSIPKVTPEIANNLKSSMLRIYAHQMKCRVEDLDIKIKKMVEPV